MQSKEYNPIAELQSKGNLSTIQQQTVKSFYSKLFLLANRMVKESRGTLTRKECFAKAKDFLIDNEASVYILEANDTKGNFSRRCVFTNWNAHNEVKGTGRPTKPGQILFVDLAAKLVQSRRGSTRSFYEENIRDLYNRVSVAA